MLSVSGGTRARCPGLEHVELRGELEGLVVHRIEVAVHARGARDQDDVVASAQRQPASGFAQQPLGTVATSRATDPPRGDDGHAGPRGAVPVVGVVLGVAGTGMDREQATSPMSAATEHRDDLAAVTEPHARGQTHALRPRACYDHGVGAG